MSLISELRPENIPVSKRVNPGFSGQDPLPILRAGVHAEHDVPNNTKRKGASESAQIAHYKMITAHIRVLLCFRK